MSRPGRKRHNGRVVRSKQGNRAGIETMQMSRSRVSEKWLLRRRFFVIFTRGGNGRSVNLRSNYLVENRSRKEGRSNGTHRLVPGHWPVLGLANGTPRPIDNAVRSHHFGLMQNLPASRIVAAFCMARAPNSVLGRKRLIRERIKHFISNRLKVDDSYSQTHMSLEHK